MTTPPSLRWDIPSTLDEGARTYLRIELDAAFLDENATRPGYGKLAPDVRVVVRVSDNENPSAVIAHWSKPIDGIPATDPDWVITWVSEKLRQAFGDVLGPSIVEPG